jgi:hypothetical protein
MLVVAGSQGAGADPPFAPKGLTPGAHRLDVGTAGRTSLVAQAALPARGSPPASRWARVHAPWRTQVPGPDPATGPRPGA